MAAMNEERRLWWPIRLKLHRGRMSTKFFDWHGVEMGSERMHSWDVSILGVPWPWRKLLAQTFHIAWGHLQVQLGYERPTEKRQ